MSRSFHHFQCLSCGLWSCTPLVEFYPWSFFVTTLLRDTFVFLGNSCLCLCWLYFYYFNMSMFRILWSVTWILLYTTLYVGYVESEITVEWRDWYDKTKKRLLLLLWNGCKIRVKCDKMFLLQVLHEQTRWTRGHRFEYRLDTFLLFLLLLCFCC